MKESLVQIQIFYSTDRAPIIQEHAGCLGTLALVPSVNLEVASGIGHPSPWSGNILVGEEEQAS